MRPAFLLAGFVPLFCATAEQTRAVCLDDRVGLGRDARQAFDRELATLTQSALQIADSPSSETACIRLSVRIYAPARYSTALGLAFAREGRVLPAIELYTANILRVSQGGGGAEPFGRALARVAFHELQHVLRQEAHHEKEGLFRASLTAAELGAAGR